LPPRAQETFFLSANLLDRFLAERGLPLAAGDMNLLGITCLWVSSKHEETWKSELTVDQCVGVLDGSPPVNHELWRSKVQKAEEDVLARVRFQVKAPTAHTFLARFLAAARIEEATSVGFLAQLFCELCLASYTMLRFRPSEVAAWPSVVEGVCSLAQALSVARLVRMGRPDLRMIARAAAAAANDEEGASRFSAAAPPPGQLTVRGDAGGEQRPHSAASAAETVVLVAGPPSLAAAASDFALAEGHTFHTERFEW
jgi:hypothetical protein